MRQYVTIAPTKPKQPAAKPSPVPEKPSASDHIAKPLPKVSAKAKTGRPRIEDKSKTLMATKPWLAMGMSRSTWYLRQREERLKK
jgi:hypothetical protein